MRKVFLGDWSRVVRDPIDLIRASYIAGALAFAVAGKADGALRLFVTALAVIAARLIGVPRPFDLGFCLGMALQGWGNAFNLFDTYSWYDSVVHLFLSLFVAPLFYIGLARLEVVPDLDEDVEERHHLGVFVITTALGVAFGAVYEIYEYVADHAFGAHLAIGYADTISDLGFDLAGSMIGGGLLVVWGVYGWGTSRRVPEKRLAGVAARRGG
jgi:hypothetical protein